MPDSFNLSAEIIDVVDRARAWRFIQGFATHWSTPLTGADGYDDPVVQQAEDRLGVRFPAALHEAYKLLGRRQDLVSNQDILLAPDRLRLDETGETLVFRHENQWCAQWGVRLADFQHPDPPVVWGSPHGVRDTAWKPYITRLSLAFVEIVLSESLFSTTGLSDNRELDPPTVELLNSRFTRLQIPDYPLWAAPDGPPVRWYSGPGIVLRDDGRTWLWVRGRTPEALNATRRTLSGDWLMLSEQA